VTIETLRLRGSGGEVVAEANPVGAGIRSLSVDGVDLVQGYSGELPPGKAGTVLVPWPNRIDHGRWQLDGETQQLDITEPRLDTAIHGLLPTTRYVTQGRTESSITLGADISGHAGYPFELQTEVRYELVDCGIEATHRITNGGGRPAPVAIGAHPYLRVGDVDANDLAVRIAARTAVLLDERNLPTHDQDVSGSRYDLRSPVSVREVVRHACFTGLELTNGRYELSLIAPDGRETVVWGDEAFRWAQLYVTDTFPHDKGFVTAVALEPMTAPPNSLASGIGLHWIEPGDEWIVRRGIELRPTSR
jgi:aldose 1-epimerase